MKALSICPDCSGYVPESTACPHCQVAAPRNSRAMRLLKRSLKFVAAGAMSVTVSACYGGPVGETMDITSIAVTDGAVVVSSSFQLSATATLAGGDNADVTETALWATNSAGIATVVGGLVTGVSPGTALISAEQELIVGTGTVTVTTALTAVFAWEAPPPDLASAE